MTQDFDLDLPSLWFTSLPPAFPVPSMKANGPTASTYSYSQQLDLGGAHRTLVASCRWLDDLSTTKVRLTWQDADPLATVVAEQRHSPAPAPLTHAALDAAHARYGESVAAWCEARAGGTVGDGECWTLVHAALQDLARAHRARGREPPLASQGRSHGCCILALAAGTPGSNAGLVRLADVRRGDVLQLSRAHFRTVTDGPARTPQWGTWQGGRAERNVRLAHHTAVVVRVEGDRIAVVEQNAGVPGGVAEGAYDVGEMVAGEVRVYRVVGEGWCRPLEAGWE